MLRLMFVSLSVAANKSAYRTRPMAKVKQLTVAQ